MAHAAVLAIGCSKRRGAGLVFGKPMEADQAAQVAGCRLPLPAVNEVGNSLLTQAAATQIRNPRTSQFRNGGGSACLRGVCMVKSILRKCPWYPVSP